MTDKVEKLIILGAAVSLVYLFLLYLHIIFLMQLMYLLTNNISTTS